MSAMYDGLRVMFVEDDPAVRAATAQTLDLAGFEIEQHASAESALKNLKEYFPGVLLVDFQLTGMNGIALLERAMTIDRSLPVIIVTGHGDISIAVKAMHAGAYDFLEKPVSTTF
jgi:two-component system C4-dicarboxylate transport response regulator DctD